MINTTMANSQLLVFFFIFLSSLASITHSHSTLTLDYYSKTCPQFEHIITTVSHEKQSQNPTTAAAVLRIYFHDCVIGGCDASLLLKQAAEGAANATERDHDMNHSLAGDGFDLIHRVKSHLEIACPGIVSCSDILAVATRNLIVIAGGPHHKVPLGRKDSRVSLKSSVDGNLAKPNMSMDQIISMFQAKGFNVQEMVALVGGGHTIGFVHCNEFSNRIFGPKVDPSINPKLAEALRKVCANYTTNPALSAFLDVMNPGEFDNTIFKSLQKGLGVLASDQAMMSDPRTRPIVQKYAADQMAFFQDFSRAMVKLSIMGVKTGNEGEVRRRCDRIN